MRGHGARGSYLPCTLLSAICSCVRASSACRRASAPTRLATNPRALRYSAAYYRGAMGILLVYDITDTASFNNVRNWVRNIEQHAGDNVNKVGMRARARVGSLINC